MLHLVKVIIPTLRVILPDHFMHSFGIIRLLCFMLALFPAAGISQEQEIPVLKSTAESQVKSGIKLGQEMVQRGQYDSAIALFNDLKSLCAGLPEETRLTALIGNHTGASYLFKGNFELAVQQLSQAAAPLLDSPRQHSMLLVRIYNNLSLALNRIADNENALSYLQKAEDIARRYDHIKMLPAVLINKGRIFKEREQWEKSKTEFDKVLVMLDTVVIETNILGVSPREIKQLCYTNLGQLYISLGDMPRALAYLQMGDALFTPASNPYYRVPHLIAKSRIYLDRKEYTTAEQYLREAMALSEKNGIGDGISESAQRLSELYAAKGKFEKAYDYHVVYKNMEDSLRKSEKTKEIWQLETKYRIMEKDKKLAENRLLHTEQERILKNRNLWIVLISAIALLATLILIITFRSYRQKQKLQQQHLYALEKDKQIAVMKAMLEGEEKERGRIAGNLHDGIGSIISAVKMNFSILKLNHIENRDIYSKGMVLLDEAARELRATAHNLMPEMLVQEGLEAAVSSFCKRMEQTKLLRIECQMNGDFGDMAKDMELLVYRIAQELVNNIVKHAQATSGLVQINYGDGLLVITAEDNGKGMPGQYCGEGMGLRSIREKVTMLGGRMSIESVAGEGAQVYLEIDC